MAERVSRKRRRSLQLQAECMRAAKARISASVHESSAETTEEEPFAWSQRNESSDDDYGSDFTQEDAGAAYQDWLATITLLVARQLHFSLWSHQHFCYC